MRQKPDVFFENASHRTLCCVTSPPKPANNGVSSSKILAERGQFQDAYGAAQEITNAYKKAVAIQYILDMQTALKRAQEKAAEQGNNLVE